ncbi:UDP-glucuronosyltransferase 2B13, partial [Orchesella cincta]
RIVQLFLNSTVSESKNEGFVYISLGSLASSSDLPDKIQQVFFDTIKSFPQLKFLWKWNGKLPSELPSNIFFAKWFPQIDVLAHPDIKAFITQGGRPSSSESVYYKVPMITFPVLGDQDFNSKRMNQMGGNVLLELGTVTRKQLTDALHKVVYDPTMKERMENLQKILVDQPVMPLPTAVWCTEYVLRHPDTSHLRPSTFHQTWYQRRLLDVWAFVFTIIVGGVVLIVFVWTFVFKKLYEYIIQTRVAVSPKLIKSKTT